MSLDDLSTTAPPARTIPEDTQEYLDYLQTLLENTEVYGYACTTLEGIHTTIAASGRVTDGQRRAVRNIVQGGDEAQARKASGFRSRRYEGYGQ